MQLLGLTLGFLAVISNSYGTYVDPHVLDACPGYKATHVSSKGASFNATLVLAGKACNVFGEDLTQLSLQVTYETSEFAIQR